MSFCLPGRWQICPTSRPFLAAHAMFAPVVGGFNKSDWRLGAQPFKYTLNWKILEDFDWNILTDPKTLLRSKSCFNPGRSTEDETLFFQEVTESWNEMKNVKTWWLKPTSFVPPDLVPSESVPSLGSCCRGTRPNGIKSTSLPGRKSGKLTTGNLLVSKMQPIKNLQIPTSKFMTGLEWLKFPKFLSLLASQHDLVTA